MARLGKRLAGLDDVNSKYFEGLIADSCIVRQAFRDSVGFAGWIAVTALLRNGGARKRHGCDGRSENFPVTGFLPVARNWAASRLGKSA
jgi:hypothetical protein